MIRCPQRARRNREPSFGYNKFHGYTSSTVCELVAKNESTVRAEQGNLHEGRPPDAMGHRHESHRARRGDKLGRREHGEPAKDSLMHACSQNNMQQPSCPSCAAQEEGRSLSEETVSVAPSISTVTTGGGKGRGKSDNNERGGGADDTATAAPLAWPPPSPSLLALAITRCNAIRPLHI